MESNVVCELVNVSSDYAFGLNPAIEGVRQLFPGQRVKITTGQSFKQAELLRNQYKNMLEIVQTTSPETPPTQEETPEVPSVEVPVEEAPSVPQEIVVEEEVPVENVDPEAVEEETAPDTPDTPDETVEDAPETETAAEEDVPVAKKRGRRPTRRSE